MFPRLQTILFDVHCRSKKPGIKGLQATHSLKIFDEGPVKDALSEALLHAEAAVRAATRKYGGGGTLCHFSLFLYWSLPCLPLLHLASLSTLEPSAHSLFPVHSERRSPDLATQAFHRKAMGP